MYPFLVAHPVAWDLRMLRKEDPSWFAMIICAKLTNGGFLFAVCKVCFMWTPLGVCCPCFQLKVEQGQYLFTIDDACWYCSHRDLLPYCWFWVKILSLDDSNTQIHLSWSLSEMYLNLCDQFIIPQMLQNHIICLSWVEGVSCHSLDCFCRKTLCVDLKLGTVF